MIIHSLKFAFHYITRDRQDSHHIPEMKLHRDTNITILVCLIKQTPGER